jgi:hypothetical protein
MISDKLQDELLNKVRKNKNTEVPIYSDNAYFTFAGHSCIHNSIYFFNNENIDQPLTEEVTTSFMDLDYINILNLMCIRTALRYEGKESVGERATRDS